MPVSVALHPLLLCLLLRLVGPFFTLGTDYCSFSLVLPSSFSLYPTDTPCLPLSLINPPPPSLSCPLHSSPEAVGERRERERGRGRKETRQASTVENIVYARHKAACNFCSRGDTHKGREGGGRRGTDGQRQAGRK